jgi:hypothetical protein
MCGTTPPIKDQLILHFQHANWPCMLLQTCNKDSLFQPSTWSLFLLRLWKLVLMSRFWGGCRKHHKHPPLNLFIYHASPL